MGDEADDILRSFTLSAEDRRKYAPVKNQFDVHFVKRRNVMYERATFNQRKQEEGEPVDALHHGTLCSSRTLAMGSYMTKWSEIVLSSVYSIFNSP